MAEKVKMKVPPQNLEAERSVVGGMLIDKDAVSRVLEFLIPDDFYSERHKLVYSAIISLYQKNEPADLVTVTNELRSGGSLDGAGGASYLSTLVDATPTAANIVHYAKIVHEKAILRRLISGATEIAEMGYDEGQAGVDDFLDHAEQIIFEVAQRKFKPSFFAVKDIVKDSFKAIEELYEKKEMITGVATGFHELDRLTSGLQNSDLIIVAGRPSMGKTALALNIAAHAAMEAGVATAVFSLEMAKEQLVQRLLCSEAKVDAQKLRGGFLSDSDWPKLTRAAGSLSEANIYIDDSPAMNVLEMRAKSRRLQKDKGLGLIIVDYLQLMRGVGRVESREREISEISRSLKALAKELKVPVVALSQLNRAVENRQDRRPQLADLRESGSIEQDSDVVMFVYRDEVYNRDSEDKGTAEIIVGKQRNGPIGRTKLAFISKYTRFENLAHGMDDPISAPPVDAPPGVGDESPF
jgi:replicative DNA helicase